MYTTEDCIPEIARVFLSKVVEEDNAMFPFMTYTMNPERSPEGYRRMDLKMMTHSMVLETYVTTTNVTLEQIQDITRVSGESGLQLVHQSICDDVKRSLGKKIVDQIDLMAKDISTSHQNTWQRLVTRVFLSVRVPLVTSDPKKLTHLIISTVSKMAASSRMTNRGFVIVDAMTAGLITDSAQFYISGHNTAQPVGATYCIGQLGEKISIFVDPNLPIEGARKMYIGLTNPNDPVGSDGFGYIVLNKINCTYSTDEWLKSSVGLSIGQLGKAFPWTYSKLEVTNSRPLWRKLLGL